MKTRDLVNRLASDVSPVERSVVADALGTALIHGLAGSATLLVVLYGVRSDMPELILTPMFWLRLAFPLATIVAAMKLAELLGRPGAEVSRAWLAVAAPVVTMIGVACCLLLTVPQAYRLDLVLGTTWRTATFNIVFVSLPPLVTTLRAMKALAPTRLALAGAGAGVLAGAQGVLVYSLNCAEMEVPFWAVWYVLAITATTGLGAAIAPRYLRW
ncbi:DUF1109 domain-containing protein [Pararobbsia alpina]|uniref:DUF1109 domain-containing protein n=1 Tax=Pararobbsia alpina TaxID=621374 RepID=UPI0039A49D42